MHFHKSIALILGSLVGLAACSGGAAGAGEGGGGGPSVAGEDVARGEDGGAAPDPGVPGVPAADGGAGVDGAAAAPAIPKHCVGPAVGTDVCIENAQGRAGEVVDVEVVLLSNATCGAAWEASGHVAFDLTKLHVENEIDRMDCRLRLVGPSLDGRPDLAWQAFGGGSLAGCAAELPAGKVDTLKVKIAPGTPPGDYPLAWIDAAFIGNANAPLQCTTIGKGLGGTVRVLP